MANKPKLFKAGSEPASRRLPMKRSINFASVNESRVDMKAAVPLIAVIIVLAVLFSRFAVYDRMMQLDAANSEVVAAQAELDDLYGQLAELEDIPDEYAHYTWAGATQEELSRVDRVAVMELLDRVVYPRAEVTSWDLTGNCLNIPVTASTLEEVNSISRLLEEDPMVDFCTVVTASTSEYNAEEYDGVTAVITVYFVSAEEGETE